MDKYRDNTLNDAFSSHIINNVGVYDVNIYTEQMEEDLAALEYIMNNVYSGKDTLKKRGIDVSEKLQEVITKIKGTDSLNKVTFFDLICTALDDIRDSHLVFALPYFFKNHRFCPHNTMYFADIILQKDHNEYIVVASNDSSVKCGDQIAADESQLHKTVGSRLLYGVFSETNIQNITCVCNGKEIKLKVNPIPAKPSQNSPIWSYEKYEDIDIVTIHRFSTFNAADEQEMNSLISLGQKLKESKNIILDLRGNGGGNSEYARKFVENLNGSAVLNLNYAKLDSQGCRLAEISHYAKNLYDYEKIKNEVLQNPVSEWKYVEPEPIQTAGYKNDIVLLTDRNTASTAEIMIKCVKDNIPQSIVIGENTGGVLNTGDIRYYYLPNSKIFLNIPTAVFADIFDEGTGFLPDFWSKDDAMQSAISYLRSKY